MKDRRLFVFLTKDAMCKDYLHHYGIKPMQQKTPNIDEIASQGTIFDNYYTAAGSTVMSFFSMATGLFAHETEFQMYERCHYKYKGETLFTRAKEIGYDECHIIWDDGWNPLFEYYDYFRDDVTVHSLDNIREKNVGIHKTHAGVLANDDEKVIHNIKRVEKVLADIVCGNEKNIFVWIHLPHVLLGRDCYGSDIDVFDQYVGMIRKYFPDNCIAISADHGNMNGYKGKLAYGFDVYNKVISIPLITPRFNNQERCTTNVSSVDIFSVLLKHEIPNRKFIYCDSAYRAQITRRLAIIYKNYKYIYNKRDASEELYDLTYDPDENLSLIKDTLFDIDRKITVPICEEYLYPAWDTLEDIRNIFRIERKRIWRDGDRMVIMKSNLKDFIRPIYDKYLQYRRHHGK